MISTRPALNESPTDRREWAIAATLIAVGIGLRLWVAGRSAVEHFDEGVYASNLYFGEPQFTYPMQHLYAPPLLPTLIESGMIAGLPPNLAAILPSLLAGSVTLIAVWRIARRWFGPAAGLASLTLASLSDFHIAYSSAALTDVLLTLLVLLAVGATARALAWAVSEVETRVSAHRADVSTGSIVKRRTDRRRAMPASPQPASPQPASANQGHAAVSSRGSVVDKWAVIAGLLTAAAWWTKYNGWLPLAIGAAGTALLLVLYSSARPRWKRLGIVVGLMTLVAIVGWSPVPLGLDDVGGYSAVAANHATYVVGPAGWIRGASRQIANQSAMEGVLSWISISVGFVLATSVTPKNKSVESMQQSSRWLNRSGRIIGWGLLLAIAAVLESTFLVLLVLSSCALIWFLRKRAGRSESSEVGEAQIGLCLAMAWFGGLVVATPNYWPYPRLLLPLLACLWLVAGSGLAGLAARCTAPATLEAGGRRFDSLEKAVLGGLLLALLLASTSRSSAVSRLGSLALDRSGMQRAATEIATEITRDMQANGDETVCIILVQAEPALVFQLHAAGFPFVQPVIAPPEAAIAYNGEEMPTYYVLGPHAQRDKQFLEHWETVKQDFRLLDELDANPSAIVLLDSHDPRALPVEPERIWLYRRKPADRVGGPGFRGSINAENGFDTSGADR